jgi:hypothetical protein
MGEYVRKIGSEKKTLVDKDFDYYYDYYKKKAEDSGYYGELKFSKERGKIIFFVELDGLNNSD